MRSEGEDLFHGSSSWMVISMEKKMPAMMKDVLRDIKISSNKYGKKVFLFEIEI